MRILLLSLLLTFACALPSFAQSRAGLPGITGVIQNASGGLIFGVKVVAANASLGIPAESGKLDSEFNF